MVKTLPSNTRGAALIPGQGTLVKVPHVGSGGVQQKIKKGNKKLILDTEQRPIELISFT